MRAADPVHNVELRRDRYGHESVVLAFPTARDVVDAVRAIPGRRFDWEAQGVVGAAADATAPYVKGVLERHPWLTVAPDVAGWLARPVTGWVGRVDRGRADGAGASCSRRSPASCRTSWPRSPSSAAAGCGCRSRRGGGGAARAAGARLDQRAQRCAQHLQVGLEPAPATLSLIESVGEPRFKLEVNWDPDTVPAFLALPAARRTAARCRSTPTCSSRSSTSCARSASTSAPNAAACSSACGPSTTRRSTTSAARARTTGRRSRSRPCSAASCARSSARACATRWRRGGAFLADEQGLGKTVEALAALEADDAFPAIVVCPASLKLNWLRETERWLPHRTSPWSPAPARADAPTSRSSTTRSSTPTARGWRCAAAGARPRRVALRQEPAGQAHPGGAPARRGAARGRCGSR